MTETTSENAQSQTGVAGDTGQAVPSKQVTQAETTTARADHQAATALQTPASAAGMSPAPPAAGQTGGGQLTPKQVPSLGRIVIARYPHRQDAPAMVTFVHSETVVDLQIFRGDHLPHNGQKVAQMEPTNTDGTGWFWPPRT